MTTCAVDTLLKEHQAATLRERRAVDRQPFVRPVQVLLQRGETVLTGFTRDVSRNGVSLICDQEVRPGMMAVLQIHSLKGPPIEIRAEARWCDTFGAKWFATGWYFIESA